jgi:ABC-type transport system involved in multi-copper enzyme maturation permease subunit
MITTLAIKELKHLFATPLAWLVLGVMQVVLAWLFLGQLDAFFAVQAQLAELANPPGITEIIVMPLFGSAALLLMLATPLLGMHLIAGERHDRTFALLLSAPLSMVQIVLGKFLGLAFFLGAAAVLPAAMACSLYLGGTLDAGLLAANLLGLLLLAAAFAALSLFMSSLTAHPTLAAVATLGAFLALWLISLPAAEPGSWLHAYSPLKHFEQFNRGLLGWGGLAFFVAFATLLLMLTACRLEIELRGWTKRRVALVATVVGAAFLLAPYAQQHPLSRDITQNGRHSLSKASREVLRQMPGPVTITAYASRQDIELGDIRKIIADFLESYRNAKPDFTLKFIDPAAQPQLARKAGIQANGEMVINYRNRSEHLATLNEQALTNALLRLARNRQTRLGFLDGHGERKLTGGAPHDLGSFGKQLENRGIKPVLLDLSASAEIMRHADVLLITTPQNDLLPGEAEKIKTFLAQGGNLLWLLEPGPLHGLQPLAETLELALTPGTVIDPDARGHYATPAVAQISAYGHHAATDNFDLTSVLPEARQIGFNESENWHVTSLAESSEQSWVENDTPDSAATFDPQRDIPGPVTLAAALERTVEDKAQRIVVVGSAAFLSNAYLGLGGNLDLGINLVSWLSGDDNLIAIQPKATIDARLNLSKGAATAIAVGFLFALPLAFFVCGATIWWRRRKSH